MEDKNNIGFQIVEELLGIKEQLEDFNNLHLDKVLTELKEINRHLHSISYNLDILTKG